jgi:hypothetical protein
LGARRGPQRRIQKQNYKIRDIAEVGEVFTGCRMAFGEPSADHRSYRVAFDKIRSVLPSFDWGMGDARRGARQLLELFSEINLERETFEPGVYAPGSAPPSLQNHRIDERFFWRE